MLKSFTILCLVIVFAGFGFVRVSNAQSADKAAKKTEKFRQKIKSYGTGERVSIGVELMDKTKLRGYIQESNDTNFTLVDKEGAKRTIAYSEVNEAWKRGGSGLATGAAIGVLAGVGATIAIIFGVLLYR